MAQRWTLTKREQMRRNGAVKSGSERAVGMPCEDRIISNGNRDRTPKPVTKRKDPPRVVRLPVSERPTDTGSRWKSEDGRTFNDMRVARSSRTHI